MAGYSSTYNGVLNSDAAYRAWIQKVEAAIVASGAVVQDATIGGQIDPTTVTYPGTTVVYSGFRIYKFADATKGQLYMKVEFGTGTTASVPRLRVSFGITSDGSGVLSNTFGAAIVVTSSSIPGTADPIFGGGGAYGSIVAAKTGTGSSYCFGMTRMLAEDGTVANGAIVFTSSAGQSLSSSRSNNTSMTTQVAMTGLYPDPVGGGSTAGSAGKIGLFRGFLMEVGDILEIPLLACRNAEATLISAASAFTATWRGASHTWLPISLAGSSGNYLSSSGSGLCMLWE